MTDSHRVIRIAMWSGPRNISTALMRAFENRADTAVWDEPFYAHYLSATGIAHPMAADIIGSYETDWRKIVERLTGPPPGGAHLFYQKHMTHHMLDHIGLDWLDAVENCFLIRRPESVVASYAEKRDSMTLQDLGIPQQQRIFEHVSRRTDRKPPIVDADDVLENPRGMLTALCRAIGIAFDENMLSWPVGRRQTDGIWAAHWYGAVERSSGFSRPQRKRSALSPELAEIACEARPVYDALYAQSLRPAAN